MVVLNSSLLLAVLLLISSFVYASVDDVSKDLEITASFPSGKNEREFKMFKLYTSVNKAQFFFLPITKGKRRPLSTTLLELSSTKKIPNSKSFATYDLLYLKYFKLTASRTRISIAPGAKANLTYKFKVELEPRDIGFIVNLDWYTEVR
ncbi:hypothetical protein HK096_000130 [Nowakowskiella sp. JEL0078]|nr:hypothetical protein HK096_000130 [Nowakowskiella sp. JEL0078]